MVFAGAVQDKATEVAVTVPVARPVGVFGTAVDGVARLLINVVFSR